MLSSNEAILRAVAGGTLLLIFFAIVVVVAILKYQNRRRKHFQEMTDIRNDFRQELLSAQLEVRDQTLKMISQEIHDNVGQVLSLAKLNLNKILVTDASPESERLSATKDLVGKAIQDLRSLAKTLGTQFIADRSLAQWVQSDVDAINRTGEYTASMQVNGLEKTIDSQHQLILYRIIQEAINNSLKHAKGSRIGIELSYHAESLLVLITDNGMGFDVGSARTADPLGGSGLYNMQNRARLIGASFEIVSSGRSGTSIRLTLTNLSL